MELPPLPPPPPWRIERAVAPIAFPDPILETALQEVLFPPGASREACQRQGGARYIFNRFDLDGDRQPETLVALLGQRRCGREGCPLLLLKRVGPRLVPFQRLMGLRSSLVVAEQRNHGWLDLILPTDEGGRASAPVRLTHDGAAYGFAAASDATATAAGDRAAPVPLTLGIAALSLRPSPWLVQGHALPCPSAAKGATVPQARAPQARAPQATATRLAR
ncbi:MAG: hypothetical protein RLZZ117_2107 [Cyanobacteriota bacterium]|jgi:hypothetical protein